MTGGRAPLHRVLLIAQRLQQINERWEMRGAALFLLVTIRGEITKPQIERQLKMSKGSSHRNIEMMQDACDLKVLAEDRNRKVSKGYVRGELWSVKQFG